eukprot:2928762-Pleurochrysis_carterae.AAC.8
MSKSSLRYVQRVIRTSAGYDTEKDCRRTAAMPTNASASKLARMRQPAAPAPVALQQPVATRRRGRVISPRLACLACT